MSGEIKEYYVYMIRCEDDSLYTGITTDLQRRLKEHLERGKKCAKYTMSHHAKKLEVAWKAIDKISASKLEYFIKTLNKTQKEEIIKNPSKIGLILAKKIDSEQYSNVKNLQNYY